MIQIEVINDIARLRQFVPEWTLFLGGVLPPSPFQTPRWLLTWWSHFGSGRLHVLVFRENGRPVGVLPCFLHEWNGRRQLTLIGTGVSDYLDPVLDPQHESAIVESLQCHLEKQAEWEICDWQDLMAETPLGSLAPVAEGTPGCRAALGGSFETFLEARPHGLKRNLRRYREKALALGPLRFTVSSEAEPLLVTALIDLHRQRWQQSGECGMIASNGAEAFVPDAAEVMAEAGLIRIFTLYFQERVVAIILALRNQTTIFSYLSAFDPQYEIFGFGRELLARALEYAHIEHYCYWDFLRGDEPYKFTWGAQPIRKARLVLKRAADVGGLTMGSAMRS